MSDDDPVEIEIVLPPWAVVAIVLGIAAAIVAVSIWG